MKLLFDFLPVVLFFVVFKSYDDIKQGTMAATAVLIVATLAQLAWSWYRYRRIEKMPLIAAVLVVVFGGITLMLQDEVYLQWKPTVVNWLFALGFLGSQFIGKKPLIARMMGGALSLSSAVWTRLNMAWVAFFVLMGIVNLYVAFNFDMDTWVNFKLFGILGLTIVFVLAQAYFLAPYIETAASDPADSKTTETSGE